MIAKLMIFAPDFLRQLPLMQQIRDGWYLSTVAHSFDIYDPVKNASPISQPAVYQKVIY